MVWKIVSLIGIAITAFFLFRRAGGVTPAAARAAREMGAPRASGDERVVDLVPCSQCGAYRPRDGICDCQRAPTL